MSNVQWRKMYAIATEIISEIRQQKLTPELKLELDRITNIVNSKNEIESFPTIAREAPFLDFKTMPSIVEIKYNELIAEAKRFK